MSLQNVVDKAEAEYQALLPLVKEFGERNVEEACIFVTKACDSKGLRVSIRPAPEMVRAILEAVHGRLGVNAARVNLDGAFYLKPTVLDREGKEI